MLFSRRSAYPRVESRWSVALERARAADAIEYDLTISAPSRVGLGVPIIPALSALPPEALGAWPMPAEGPLATRRAVARALGRPMEDVLLVASTSEAYRHLFALLTEPGDRIASEAPSYPLLDTLAALDGLSVVRAPLGYAGGWSRIAPLPDARVAMIVSPNNPTGHYTPDETLGALAQRYDAVIVDEVFAPYPVEAPAPAASRLNEGLVIRLGGLSKYCGLPQAKLSWMILEGDASRVAEAKRRLVHILDAHLSLSLATAAATPAWLEAAPSAQAEIRARISENVGTMRDALAGSAADLLRVEGGFFGCIRLPDLASDESFALRLLARGVATLPGFLFDFAGPPHLVVSLLVSPASISAGGARIAEVVTEACAEDART